MYLFHLDWSDFQMFLILNQFRDFSHKFVWSHFSKQDQKTVQVRFTSTVGFPDLLLF